jgi:Xaa-Pro dipeptidase
LNVVDILKQSPLPKELTFPVAEFKRRVGATQALMRERGIDFLLISITPNLGYLTGYDTTMPSGYTVGILGQTGNVRLHASELEATCALLSSTIEDIDVFYWHSASDTATQLAGILRDLGAQGRRIGIEMDNPETFASGAMQTRTHLRLRELLPQAEFVDATHLVLDVRCVKSQAEIAKMRQAAQWTLQGLLASIDACKEGRTDNEVVAEGYYAMVKAGSELMSIDPMCIVGPRTGYMPHVPYKRKKLQNGDPIYLEYTATFDRYNAPGMRSAVIGQPSKGVRQLSDAALETLDLLFANVRPGRTGDDVAQIAKRGLAKAPEGTFFHGAYGYSIGMGHQPTWTEAARYICEGSKTVLVPGMTFHLPLCIWVPKDKYGIGFSESIVVTETGCEILGPGNRRELAVR